MSHVCNSGSWTYPAAPTNGNYIGGVLSKVSTLASKTLEDKCGATLGYPGVPCYEDAITIVTTGLDMPTTVNPFAQLAGSSQAMLNTHYLMTTLVTAMQQMVLSDYNTDDNNDLGTDLSGCGAPVPCAGATSECTAHKAANLVYDNMVVQFGEVAPSAVYLTKTDVIHQLFTGLSLTGVPLTGGTACGDVFAATSQCTACFTGELPGGGSGHYTLDPSSLAAAVSQVTLQTEAMNVEADNGAAYRLLLEGLQSDIDADLLNPDNCGNCDDDDGGVATCDDLLNSNNCVCASGYTGDNCETAPVEVITHDLHVYHSLMEAPCTSAGCATETYVNLPSSTTNWACSDYTDLDGCVPPGEVFAPDPATYEATTELTTAQPLFGGSTIVPAGGETADDDYAGDGTSTPPYISDNALVVAGNFLVQGSNVGSVNSGDYPNGLPWMVSKGDATWMNSLTTLTVATALALDPTATYGSLASKPAALMIGQDRVRGFFGLPATPSFYKYGDVVNASCGVSGPVSARPHLSRRRFRFRLVPLRSSLPLSLSF